MGPNSNTQEALFERLQTAVFKYEDDTAKQITRDILAQNVDPLEVMDGVVTGTAQLLGEKFESGEIFIPHLVMAGEILSEVADILHGAMSADSAETTSGKVVVIGTVESDIHSIGKSIVAMLLKANGFKVHDLGVEVKSDVFVKEAKTQNADIIAMSCLLTTTMPYQQEVIEDLEDLNLRGQFKIMIGGGPITQEWADEIRADGFGVDAIEAVKVAKQLLT